MDYLNDCMRSDPLGKEVVKNFLRNFDHSL